MSRGVLIADTSALFAGMTDTHPAGKRIRDLILDADAPPIVSPMVMAELDYLVSTRLGGQASLTVLDELTGGAYEVAAIALSDLIEAREVVAQYIDMNVGLTDAVNVILAARVGTDAMLTLDERHFRALRPRGDRFSAFRVLPADS
ncbi:MAG: PIN domain-containing protein [Micromonosporaceae bacterium]|nr:PIN domain-containing protein [Micromonosporaceae bacterium]